VRIETKSRSSKFYVPGVVATAVLLVLSKSGPDANVVAGFSPRLGIEFSNPVARLAAQIDRGEVSLDYGSDGWGYLRSLLKHLDVNIDSQVLVFSKTSFQLSRISPKTPRAIFFNDNVSIGSVQGGPMFELAALEPAQGIVYYTMDAGEDGM